MIRRGRLARKRCQGDGPADITDSKQFGDDEQRTRLSDAEGLEIIKRLTGISRGGRAQSIGCQENCPLDTDTLDAKLSILI